MSDLAQAPEEIVKKFTEFGFKKLWINKEFQRFHKTFANYIENGSVPLQLFLEKTGSDELEAKVFTYLFDANGDGVINFEEVLQSTGFMETDDMDIQAKLFFDLIDKDQNGMLSKDEMKKFLAIHHLKRTGNFPTAADQEGLEDVVAKIFDGKEEMTVDEFLSSDHGMMTMVTFNMM